MNKLSEGADWDCMPNIKECDYSIAADLIANGNKIQAIKLLRDTYGISFSEAKKICEKM